MFIIFDFICTKTGQPWVTKSVSPNLDKNLEIYHNLLIFNENI